LKIFKIFIHTLSNICYVFILIYVLICLPYLFKYKPLVVLTGSMVPTYNVGSIIYYKEVSVDEIKVGDPITFKYDDGTFISHRVYSINDGLYETKGDANNAVDARKIEYSNIVGKDAKISIPYLGFYVKYVNDHMYLITIVAIVLLLDFILSNIKKKEGEKLNEE